jgi:hypothetical protein
MEDRARKTELDRERLHAKAKGDSDELVKVLETVSAYARKLRTRSARSAFVELLTEATWK